MDVIRVKRSDLRNRPHILKFRLQIGTRSEGRGDLEGAMQWKVRKSNGKSHITKRKGCNLHDYNPSRIVGAEGGNSLIVNDYNKLQN